MIQEPEYWYPMGGWQNHFGTITDSFECFNSNKEIVVYVEIQDSISKEFAIRKFTDLILTEKWKELKHIME